MNEIFHRTSIRNYLDKPVEPEKVEKMLQAARRISHIRNHTVWLSGIDPCTTESL